MIFWGCFFYNGPGNLVKVHGILNSVKYQDILYLNLAAPARKLNLGHCWIFQQDSGPKHTSKSTQKWLTKHKITHLPWPSQSSDVNLWAELKRRVHKRGPRTLGDLERFCKEEWSQLPFFVF